jgi:hypothetical protein
MSVDIFAPHGANPLANLKIANPRCARVDFDRSVRSNVLVMDGDIMQSKIQVPKEDRPLASLQLPQPLFIFQLMCPSSGQLAIEFTASHSNSSRVKITAGTFISRADVHDAKGTPHVKLPFAIPRNVWTQAVIHVPGVVCHLFKLPAIKWIDTISISGCARIRRIAACSDEVSALDKPSGMLLFTVPAYGPPVWRGIASTPQSAPAQQQQQAEDGSPRTTPFTMKFSRQPNGEIVYTAASERDRQQLLSGARSGNEMQLLPDEAGDSGNMTPTSDGELQMRRGQNDDDTEDDEGAALASRPAPRSPRTEAIIAALQGRTLAPNMMGRPSQPDGRVGSAPAGTINPHLAVSYRRIGRDAGAKESSAAAPKANAAPSTDRLLAAAWGSVIVDGWGDDDDNGNLQAALAVARALGVPVEEDGEAAAAPALRPSASSTVSPPPPGAAGGGKPIFGARPVAKPPASTSNAKGAGQPAVPSTRGIPPRRATGASSQPATGVSSPASATERLLAMSEEDILANCAKAPFRDDAVAFSFKPKQDRMVGYGVGDLEVERTKDSDEDDESSDSGSDSAV